MHFDGYITISISYPATILIVFSHPALLPVLPFAVLSGELLSTLSSWVEEQFSAWYLVTPPLHDYAICWLASAVPSIVRAFN